MTDNPLQDRIAKLRKEPYDASEHDVETLIADNDMLRTIIRDLQKAFLAACGNQDIEAHSARVDELLAENERLLTIVGEKNARRG